MKPSHSVPSLMNTFCTIASGHKGHAAWLEWMAFCLAPFDAGIHRAEHGGNFAPAESLVQILHPLDVTHFRFPLWYRRAPAAVAERLANQSVNFGYRHLGLACL